MATDLEELLRLADDPAFKEWPPGAFWNSIVPRGASGEFAKAAWALFKQVRREITPAEVANYMEEKK